MKLKEFKDLIITEFGRKGYRAVCQEISNITGNYMGIIISDNSGDVNVSPVIPLKALWDAYNDGVSLEHIISHIISLNGNNSLSHFDFDSLNHFGYENVKEKIFVALVHKDSNEEFLKDLPQIKWNDLTVIFKYLVSDADENYLTITIKNSMMDRWGITADELYKVALENTIRLMPAVILPMHQVIPQVLEDPEFNDQMMILSNKTPFGATAMLYTELDKMLEGIYGDRDLLILPSSIYEVLIVPLDEIDNREAADEMVREVNSTLPPTDVLSDHAYIYEAEKKRIIY